MNVIKNQNEDIPLIKFEGDASAPILRYDVPSPSSYTGVVYIETDIGKEYFGGPNIITPEGDANTEAENKKIFNLIKTEFLRENRDVIKEYLSTIQRSDLENELEYYTLKIDEVDAELIRQAKLDAAKQAASSARLNADNAKKIAEEKNTDAEKFRKEASDLEIACKEAKERYESFKASVTLPDGTIPHTRKAEVKNLENQWKNIETSYNAAITNAESAEITAENATILAEKAEQDALQAEKNLAEVDEKKPDILSVIALPGVKDLLAKYMLFRYLMEFAWKVDQKFPMFYRTMGGSIKIRFAKVRDIKPSMVFIETHKLTSFPGDYGAGTTIKTFSLLPGESTEISVKTFKKSREEMKEASSILDSYTEEKADEFEKGVQKENARSSQDTKSTSFNIGAEVGVSFGCGNASVSAGYEENTSSSREESAKNVINATTKHAQKASAKREVNVNTSFERSVEAGEETSIMRKIENLNTSRTLNFTFRQLNQQFHTILHLTDLRIGFYNGYPGSFRAYTLPELKHYAFKYMNIEGKSQDEIFNDLKQKIFKEYSAVMDYQKTPRALIEEVGNANGRKYLRTIPSREVNGQKIGKQQYCMREAKKDKDDNIIQPVDERYLDGIILSTKVLTMRTDGVIVESLLGKANALDDYALDARKEKIREKKYENNKIKLAINLIQTMISEKNLELAVNAYKEIFGIREGIEIAKELFGTRKIDTIM